MGRQCSAAAGGSRLENTCYFLELAGDIVERVDRILLSDPMTAARKTLGMTSELILLSSF
jgi:hypothetical protein